MSPDRHDDATARNRAGRAIDEFGREDDPASPSGDDDADASTGADDDVDLDTGSDDDSASDHPSSDGSAIPDRASDADQPAGRTDGSAEFGPVDDVGPRDIVVPDRLFKLVTVVTTLLAVPTIVLGFVFLDAATLQTSVARWTILVAIEWVGLGVSESIVSVFLGLVGIALLAAGAGIYIVGSRFRAGGMGNAEEDTDENSANG